MDGRRDVIKQQSIQEWTLRVRFFTKIQDRIKYPGSLGFFVKKRNDVSKKGLFLIHFHRNDLQYRRYL